MYYLGSDSGVVADDREEVGGRGDEAGDGEGVVLVPVGSEAHRAEHHCRARSEQCKPFLYENGSSQRQNVAWNIVYVPHFQSYSRAVSVPVGLKALWAEVHSRARGEQCQWL